MQLHEIMEIIHPAYPDEETRQCWNPKRNRPCSGAGDGLAEFIVREIADTYDESASDHDQIEEAIRVMQRARFELQNIIEALQSARPIALANAHENAQAA